MERMPVHGLNGVTRLQAGQCRRGTRLHFLYADGAGQILRQHADVGGVEVLSADHAGDTQGKLQRVAAAPLR